MAESSNLAHRIDAEFSAVEKKVNRFQAEQVGEFKERQKRLAKLNTVFDELREIWKPRLELLVKKFGDRVQVEPRIVPSTREATFEFQSRLARIRLKLSATTDREVQNVILSYDLDIIPVLMKFTPHAEIEFPLTAVNKEAIAQWIDDRLVEFVQTYLSLAQDEVYLKDYMVEDPVAHVRFPSMAAGASLEWQGRKVYFVGEETRQEFARQHQIVLAGQS
jgi:hypothetical protein